MFALIALNALTFVVALIYASVGHGGASGYLALLSFFDLPKDQMAASALCLNLLVSGVAFWNFFRAAHFSWKLIWPFIVTSIPFAFIGGWIKVPPSVYSLLLAVVLLYAALRLSFELKDEEGDLRQPPLFWISLLIGAGLGLISGIVGIGGGIFLSPLLLIFRWAHAKQTAAASAFFIFVNSAAGLFGRVLGGHFQLAPMFIPMIFLAFLGGLIGSRLGARHFSGKWIRRILAMVLILATFKLFKSLF